MTAVLEDAGTRPVSHSTGHRADIQALRALAVSLVLVYHLWPGVLPGGFAGVDVFFVISGFLITSHLVQRPPRTVQDLVQFWARRARRLLPLSLTVLLATVVATWLLDARTLWDTVARDVIASALYVQNWALADRSVDYLAAEQTPSPLQHYWSLSVEEQFYLGWPVVIALSVLLARLMRRPAAAVIAVALGATVLLSFAMSVVVTHQEPARAYFVTPTRIWELGVGGLLAVWVLRPARPGRRSILGEHGSPSRVVLAWAGLAAIGATALLITAATPFPGWVALAPVLGTAAVIAARAGAGAGSPEPLMAVGGVQWLGGVSYGVYLWHWPLITLVPYVSGGSAGVLDKLAVIGASLGLAQLTKRLIEDPARFGRRPSTRVVFLWAAAGTAVVVAAGALMLVQVSDAQQQARAEVARALAANDTCFGAGAMGAEADVCPPSTSGPVLPEPSEAQQDRSDAYAHDCWEDRPWSGTRTCSFGPEDAEVSVALVGNSHAGHWLPALQSIAEQEDWRVTTYLASECPATDRPAAFSTSADTQGCIDWGRRVQEETRGQAYDLVVTSERSVGRRSGSDAVLTDADLRAGYRSYVTDWLVDGTNLVVLRDTPAPGRTIGAVPECVQQHRDDLQECTGSAEAWVPADPLAEAAQEVGLPGDAVVDLTPWFCRDAVCPAVIGGVIAYADEHHMTATFARTLAPALAPHLSRSLR